MTNEQPAMLLRPRPPRVGKKVWLERVKFVWDRLSFKHKSTLRNVLRYRNRFLMTVVAVAISTSLVMAGLALLDLCLFGGMSSPSIMAIALVVVVFAGLLTMVVVYTLTNINISERNRELATLMVLGYYDVEVSGYIYREVYIDTIVGIIFGYPLSLLLMQMVFKVMAFGSISGVTWFWWLVPPVVVLFFTFLVTLLLNRKIVKIDMNESLKAIE
jgi:putative ABC transport system permease protein